MLDQGYLKKTLIEHERKEISQWQGIIKLVNVIYTGFLMFSSYLFLQNISVLVSDVLLLAGH